MERLVFFCIAVFALTPAFSIAGDGQPSQFFFSGDGMLNVTSLDGKTSFAGRYRVADGSYDATALVRLNAVFGAHVDRPAERMELRFVEFLDYLQDQLQGGKITIVSGYRSPAANHRLRSRGRPAGKASLHQYGMAADIRMANVSPKRLWAFVKGLHFGGAGFYHGNSVHVDVGPARFWDETTSKVDTDLSDNNALVMLVTDRDVYGPGETTTLRFARMTAWPVGVATHFVLERQLSKKTKKVETFQPTWAGKKEGDCLLSSSIEEMTGLQWQLPRHLKSGWYRVRATFCGSRSTSLPPTVDTRLFIVGPYSGQGT